MVLVLKFVLPMVPVLHKILVLATMVTLVIRVQYQFATVFQEINLKHVLLMVPVQHMIHALVLQDGVV